MGLKLPARYCLLSTFATLTFWILFNVMSFMYTGNSNYVIRGQRRHLENDSPTDYFFERELVQEDIISTLGMIRSHEDERIREEGYGKHAFNELVSNRLGFHREIQDTRHEMCLLKSYPSNLPSASVIICFHNEAWSALLRTVHSVLDRTAENLIVDIILVDDKSTLEELKGKLEDYVAKFPKIKLIRAVEREGLIRGRMLGAKHASGEVLVFLDSHCEVNKEWLPPLLERIKDNAKTVVCPMIDIISSETLEYQSSPLVRGGFNWGLHFSWEPVPNHLLDPSGNVSQPIRSPTMAGGLFAINRNYFNELGQYDAGMDIWGGENLEISFRIWMCGGTLEIIPCSRVGHLFRRWRPYGSDSKGDTLSYNSMRVAEVWLDDYKKYFYQVKKNLVGRPFGNVSTRVALRKKLNCKSFRWYVENVYPELRFPDNGKAGAAWQRPSEKNPIIKEKGNLQNLGSTMCLDTPGHVAKKKAAVVLRNCQETNAKFWSLNELNELKIDSLLCLDMNRNEVPKVMKCHSQGGTQLWYHNKKTLQIYHTASGMCMAATGKNSIKMAICDDHPLQQWQFTYD